MLSGDDIKKLIEAEKEVFATKDDIADLRQDYSNLQTSVDKMVKQVRKRDEIKALGHCIKKVEVWAEKVAPKVGVEIEH